MLESLTKTSCEDLSCAEGSLPSGSNAVSESWGVKSRVTQQPDGYMEWQNDDDILEFC